MSARGFPILVLSVLLVPSMRALAVQAEVFATPGHPAAGVEEAGRRGISVIVWDLAEPERLKQELSAGLPKDPKAAREVARQRLSDPDVRARIQAVYRGHARALSLRLEKVPAVVFDGRQVVYGTADVAEALNYLGSAP